MKTIKIRFIEYRKNEYGMQIKKLFGWRRFAGTYMNVFGDMWEAEVVLKSKKKLLKELRKKENIKKSSLKIIIYPTLKIKNNGKNK